MRGRLRCWRVCAVAALSLAVAELCAGQQATLVGDAHVSSARPAVNAGGLSNLNVGGGYTALVGFDLGVLPPATTAAQVTRATLRVYCNRADTPGVVVVQGVGGAWGESTVTYATLPPLGGVVQSATVPGVGSYVTFDVTGIVQGWVNAPGTNFGLALTSGAAVVQFDSKENDQTSHAPELEMVLATGSVVAGAQGATGATGAAGATGPQGLPGAVGATGAQGVAGVAGVKGATGAAGATGVSGAAGVPGATGLAGATGIAGATGVMGATGAAGATGVQGIAGVTGATGAAGFVYQGTYSSVTNYGLGDVVVWQGSSYTSLVAGNRGQTPGLSPGYWGTLTAVGATGAVGVAGPMGGMGATGALGPVGPAGQQGQVGAQGPAGQAGAQGIPGVVGATGAVGAVGPQGVAGPVGLNYRGAYSSGTNYGLADGVLWQGAGYVSLIANNHGNTPDVSAGAWSMFAAGGSTGAVGATGVVGATGAAGANGLNGATGVAGSVGATGATGLAGLSYAGTYSSATNYGLGDVVEFGGAGYVSLMVSNHGNTPGLSVGAWGLLAAEGSTGAQGVTGSTGAQGVQGLVGPAGVAGPQGVQGVAGPQGPAGAQGVAGQNGAVGAEGPMGLQGPAGQAGAQGVAGVAGPMGVTGATGVQGVAGGVGMVFQGAYNSSTNYGVGDGVLWQGAGYVSLVAGNHGQTPGVSPGAWALFAAAGESGATGAAGAQGLPGVAGPTGIQGAAGVAGSSGATGATGAAGLNFVGVYSPLNGYGVGDAVSYAGSSYVSLVAGNHGQTPGVSPAYWLLLAAQGATGPAGAQGVTGAIGATGAQGFLGATGATGAPVGFRGGWLVGQSYGVGDAVTYGGSSYIAVLGNVGREPDLSPSYWGILAAVGSAGPLGTTGATGGQGPIGVQGVAGPMGATGLAGVAGPVGSTGAVGGTGPAGVQGLAGATGPQGQQGVVGPAGVAGPVGATGIQGPAGAQGVAGQNGSVGPQGPAGTQGTAGQAGAQGIPGVAGATGLQGPAGPVGATGVAGPTGVAGATGSSGSPGLVWQGAWASSTNYAVNDVVGYQGSSYVSVTGLNVGQTPGVSSQSWSLVAAMGATGVQGVVGVTGVAGSQGVPGVAGVAGPQGLQGATGPVGPAGAQGLSGAQGVQGAQGPAGLQGVAGQAGAQGIAGTTGATGVQGVAGAAGVAGVTGATGASGADGLNGTPGLVWRGAWASSTNYAMNDAVSVGGTSYVSLAANNLGQGPAGSPLSWAVLASAGVAGAQGVAGATGVAGLAGATGAQGVAGSTGATGVAGAVGMNFRAAWVSGTNYAVNDAVTFAGSSYLALAGNRNAEPDVSPQSWAVLAQAGGAGPTGAAGAAATVSVGTVTTLAAGASATVTNTGTAQAAVLSFGIPQGAAGAAGSSGGSGGAGIGSFGAMYHAVSFSTVYYSVNSPNAAASESGGAVLAWVPQGCTATRMDVYSQQSGAIKVTLRAGPAGSVVDTAMVCSPATNGSCTVTGSVAIAAGSFVDYRIDSASGTLAGVWTALTCQ